MKKFSFSHGRDEFDVTIEENVLSVKRTDDVNSFTLEFNLTDEDICVDLANCFSIKPLTRILSFLEDFLEDEL